MQGMEIMCEQSRAFVNWAAIVFSFNQDHLSLMMDMARSKGCDGFQVTRSTKFGSKYGDHYGGTNDSLQPRPEYIASGHRYQREFTRLGDRSQDIDDYMAHNQQRFRQIKQSHDKFITPMCGIGNRGLYVSADAVLHPCSWVSFPYTSMSTERKTIWFQDSFHQMYRDRLDLKSRSLQTIMQDPIWNKLSNSFNDPTKAWVECEQKCHRSLVDHDYAVGYFTN
jgi:MoaA/NifB/PqqE/SkfB family radical SAM enzyme